MSNKDYFVFTKLSQDIHTPYGVVNFSEINPVSIYTDRLERSERHHSGVQKGDRLRIIKGRKNPIGTEGTVKWCGINNFGTTFNDALTGKTIHLNPSIRLTLDDGSEVWTTGNNCINITHLGLDNTIHEVDVSDKDYYSKLCKEAEEKFGKDDSDPVWFYSPNSHDIVYAHQSLWGLAQQSYGIYQGMLKETTDEVMAVIDDFTTDTYKFVRFSKKAIHGNLIKIVDTGTRRDMDDMWRGDTGLGDAIKAFEEAVA